MSISHEDKGDLRRIVISGRLDVEGTDSVANQLIPVFGSTADAEKAAAA